MSETKIYEYVWLDGFQPEPSIRSKIKATTDDTPPEWSLMVLQLNKQKVEAQIAYYFQ